MNPHAMYPDALDADRPELMDEIEYDVADDAEIAVEVELLRARVRAARFWGA